MSTPYRLFLALLTFAFSQIVFPQVLAANPPAPKPLPEIKIGAVLPLSGYAQAFGEEARLAITHALEDSPKNNFSYTTHFEDDRGSSTEASLAAQKLLAVNQTQVIFSNWSYGGLSVGSAVRGRPTTHLSFAWDPAVTALSKNSFIIAPPPSLLATTVMNRLKSSGVKRIVLLTMDESGGHYAHDSAAQAAQRIGIAVVKRFSINTADFSAIKSIAAQVKQLSPDYLVTTLTLPQYLELFRNLKLLQYDVPVAGISQNPETEEFRTIHPRIWWSVDYSADQDTIESIRKRTGLKDLSGYSAFYDATKAVVAVYESLPPNSVPTAEDFQASLSSFSTERTLLGTFNFNERIRQSENVVVVDQAGKYSKELRTS